MLQIKSNEDISNKKLFFSYQLFLFVLNEELHDMFGITAVAMFYGARMRFGRYNLTWRNWRKFACIIKPQYCLFIEAKLRHKN